MIGLVMVRAGVLPDVLAQALQSGDDTVEMEATPTPMSNDPTPSDGMEQPETPEYSDGSDVPTASGTPATFAGAGLAPDELLSRVRTDAAAQAGVDVERVQVGEVVEVTWGDSSLGCPQPDMFYAQVITPGYRIVVQIDGQTREYHTNSSSRFVRCLTPAPAGGS